MLACACLTNHDSVIDCVLVRDAFSILGFVILNDARLLAGGNVFPVGLEGDAKCLVSSEDKLRGRGLCGCVDAGVHG